MEFLPKDQLNKFRKYFPDSKVHEHAGAPYIFIPGLRLPAGCTPAFADALLCPVKVDYCPSRLYLDRLIEGNFKKRNWNGNVVILGRNWHAVSWDNQGETDIVQLLLNHLNAFDESYEKESDN